MTLDAQEFIRRFLLHVLPDGFMRIRHFGFLANRAKKNTLAQCRKLFDCELALPQSSNLSAKDLLLELTGIDLSRCPCCHRGTMINVSDLPPSVLNLVGIHHDHLLLHNLTTLGTPQLGCTGVSAPANDHIQKSFSAVGHCPTLALATLDQHLVITLPSIKGHPRRPCAFIKIPIAKGSSGSAV